MASKTSAIKTHGLRLLALLVLCTLALQLTWVLRIGLMRVVDPQSTSFQRSEIARLLRTQHQVPWSQTWADLPQLGPHIARAAVAAEDAGFASHSGVEWDAIETAWKRNQTAAERVQKQNNRPARSNSPKRPNLPAREAKVVGGSTITQQLAKNLFLSGERTVLRKGQELLITLMLEALLPKERILEIYLNNVEWGEGLFGAQAAAQFYFRRDAAKLSPEQAARLAAMLPAPKRFEKAPASAYLQSRAAALLPRMAAVEMP